MIIGNRKHDESYNVMMVGENLEMVNKVKYLRIILDSTISREENADFIANQNG